MMSAHKSVPGQSFLKKDASHIRLSVSTRTAVTLSLRFSGTTFSVKLAFAAKLVFAESKEATVEIPMPEKVVLIDPTDKKVELSWVALYDTLAVTAAANAESSRIAFRV